MKKLIIKFFDKIIILLLGFAGVFAGCKPISDCSCEYSDAMYGVLATKYGPIRIHYVIKGAVMNNATSKSIPNIRVIRQINENYADTLYTDADGKYI